MSYYAKTQYVAVVDENDSIIGREEKWKAHENGILHRAFTVAIQVGTDWMVQHRKHPVFDSVLDLSCSSHPVFDDLTAKDDIVGVSHMPVFVADTLRREWDIRADESEIARNLTHKGSFYYKARDPLSTYNEHEVCHLFVYSCNQPDVELHHNNDYAYGCSRVPQEVLFNAKNSIRKSFAPWCSQIFDLLH